MKYTDSLKRTLRDLQQFDFDKALEVMRLKQSGLNYREIGDRLGLTRQRTHEIYKKVSTLTVAEAETLRRIVNDYLD